LVHLFVLDIVGQPVCHLSQAAGGASGSFAWDGRNSSGERVANGAYLLVLDATLDGKDVRMMFKQAVLKGGN